jgi:hypothetical protein
MELQSLLLLIRCHYSLQMAVICIPLRLKLQVSNQRFMLMPSRLTTCSGAQLSELMVSVRSIAISFRQSRLGAHDCTRSHEAGRAHTQYTISLGTQPTVPGVCLCIRRTPAAAAATARRRRQDIRPDAQSTDGVVARGLRLCSGRMGDMCRRYSHHCKVFCVELFFCSLKTPCLIHSRCCRRQDAFARKSRERAGSDAVGTGSSDALPKMEQQVR